MMEWIKTTQKAVPLLARHIAVTFAIAKFLDQTELHKVNVTKYKYTSSNTYVQAFFNREEMEEIHKQILASLEQDKLDIFLQNYQKAGDNFVSYCRYLHNLHLTKQDLLLLFKTWAEKYARFLAFIYTGNFAIDILTKKYLDVLGKKEEDIEFSSFIEGERETQLKRRQKEISNLLRQINSWALDQRENFPKELYHAIFDSHEKYRYLGSIFLTTNTYPDIHDFISELKNFSFETVRKIPGSHNHKYAEWLQELSFYRTEMLSCIQQGEYYSVCLLNELATHLKLDYQELVYLSYDEVLRGLGKNLLPENIKARYNNYSIVLSGEELIIGLGEILEVPLVNEIKGTCACGGKVQGKVRIIRNVTEVANLQLGEILVTFMTTPDYVMAMKRAAAIVTNDGGMTCHAAILSRELDLPCVVGTKIATQVFKDGDLVEVDATNGVVKRLERLS